MNMDGSWYTANGRYMTDQYRSLQNQWMMHPQQIKDLHNTTALMKIIAEQSNAIQERNLALSEKKVALAERDMVILQRDTAIAERDNAIMERDNAIAALEFARQKMNGNEKHASPDMQYPPPQLAEAPINHTRGMHVSEALTIFEIVQQSKQRRKEIKAEDVPSKKASKPLRKNKRVNGKELNDGEGSRGQKRRASSRKHDEGKKDQDIVVLNQVIKYDESTMPPPACSCTGKLQQCYKWGNGGWQSACCTTFVSRYPLPSLPDKPHARVGGRKMSAGPFAKLLSRLVAEGHDLSTPLDLKDHWARHGTNRYITIK